MHRNGFGRLVVQAFLSSGTEIGGSISDIPCQRGLELGFGGDGISILIFSRRYIEGSEDRSNHDPDTGFCEMTTRTNPMNISRQFRLLFNTIACRPAEVAYRRPNPKILPGNGSPFPSGLGRYRSG